MFFFWHKWAGLATTWYKRSSFILLCKVFIKNMWPLCAELRWFPNPNCDMVASPTASTQSLWSAQSYQLAPPPSTSCTSYLMYFMKSFNRYPYLTPTVFYLRCIFFLQKYPTEKYFYFTGSIYITGYFCKYYFCKLYQNNTQTNKSWRMVSMVLHGKFIWT